MSDQIDLQIWLGAAIWQYNNEEYHVVINIVQQANMIRNPGNASMFLDFDVLCFLSRFKLHEEPQYTIKFFQQMYYAKGCEILDKIYVYEGSGFIEAFYEFVLDKCLENSENIVYSISQTFFQIFNDENFYSNSKFQDVHHLHFIFVFWIMLIEKHNQDATETLGYFQHQLEFPSVLESIDNRFVKNAIKKWFVIAKKEFYALKHELSLSSFDIVDILSSYISRFDINFSRQAHHARLHMAVIDHSVFRREDLTFTLLLGRTASLLETEVRILNEWLGNGQESLQKKNYPRACFLIRCVIYCEEHLKLASNFNLFNLYTDVALCCVKMGNILGATFAIQQAMHYDVLTEDREKALVIKDIAKELFTKQNYELAVGFYKGALKLVSDNEIELKRDISSNIAFMFTKLERYEDAVAAAETTIKLDRTWVKGYYRLGFSQYRLRQHMNSLATVKMGLQHCPTTDTMDLYILFFKNRGILDSRADEIGNASTEILQSVLKELLKESTNESWKALSNLILTAKSKNLNVKSISLHKCIDFNASFELFQHLVISGCNVNEIRQRTILLDKCFQKKLHKKSAFLIVNGAALDTSHQSIPPLIHCVLLTIYRRCDINVLNRMLSFKMITNISVTDRNGNTALHVCCLNECTPLHLEIVELLLEHNINRNIINFEGRTPIQMVDPLDARAIKMRAPSVESRNHASAFKKSTYNEKPAQNSKQRDEKPSSNYASKLKPDNKEYAPLPNDDGMKRFQAKDWNGALSIFSKKINKLKRKHGQDQRNCEILTFAAISLFEIFNEKSIQAFSYLKKAKILYPDKGIELTRAALVYHYGDDFMTPINSYIVNGCIKEYCALKHAQEGANVVLSLVAGKKEELDTYLTFSSLKVFHCEMSVSQFIEAVKKNKKRKQVLKNLALAWFSCAQKLFEKEDFSKVAFQIVLNILEDSNKKEDKIISSKARLYIATHLLKKGEMIDGMDWFQNGPYSERVFKELFDSWEKKAFIHLKGKKFRKAGFYVINCIHLFASNLFLEGQYCKERYKTLVDTFVKCSKEEKEFDERALEQMIKTLSKLKIQGEDLSQSMFTETKTTKIKKLIMPMLKISLQLVSDNTRLKGEILFELAVRCLKSDKSDEALKYSRDCFEIRKTDPKCYNLLGDVFFKQKKFEESRKILYEGFTISETMDDKTKLLMELFLVRGESDEKSEVDFNDGESLNAIEKCVEMLKQNDNRQAWKALENVSLYTSYTENIINQKLSLERSLHYGLSEQFIDILIQHKRWKDVTEEEFKMLLKGNYVKAASTYILKKGKDKNVLDSSLLLAVQISIKTGNLKVLNEVIKHLSEGEISDGFKSSVNACCKGKCNSNKTEVLEILMISGIDISGRYVGENVLNKLPKDDDRKNVITRYSHSTNASIVMESVNLKKKKQVEGSFFGFSKTIDRDLKIAIISLSVMVESTSEDAVQPEVKELRSQNSGDVLSVAAQTTISSNNQTIEEKIAMDSDTDDDPSDDDDVEKFIDNISFEDTWEIECTQEVYRVLRSKKVPRVMKKKIIQKIKVLASGEWPRDIQKPLEGVKDGIRLFEAKINKGSRIIWEISVSFSARRSLQTFQLSDQEDEGSAEKGAVYEDKIRIWNIALQHDEVPAMIEKIVHSHVRGQDCIIRKELKGIKQQNPHEHNTEKHPNVYMNEEFVKDYMDTASTKNKNVEKKKHLFIPPASPNKQEYNILKFYSFTSQVASRLLNVNQCNYDFPFQVSPLEYAIIQLEPEHKCPILLLGRSGTGKTTCCLYRLWSQYQNYWRSAVLSGPQLPKFNFLLSEGEEVKTEYKCEKPTHILTEESVHKEKEQEQEHDEELIVDDCEHLRQVLVTKNEVLCSEIKKNFKELCMGSSIEIYNEIEEIENKKITDFAPESYPLFITSKDLLLLLDNSLPGEKFFQRDEDDVMIHEIPGWGKNKIHLSILPMEHEIDDSDEEDDNDENDDRNNDVTDPVKKDAEKDTKPKDQVNRREVTYEVFATEIWPKLLKKKKVDFHPSLVWMEIKSFIKGSAESFVSTDKEDRLSGYLTLQQYLDVGRKRAPNFEGNREEVYEMFLFYRKLKRKSTFFDEMDVHFQLYKRLKDVIIPEWAFHQIYVDETQDFTQAELLLMIRCSANPNALFFTGDTAQSIMSGVAFRFCDLQSLFVEARKEFESLKFASPVVVPKRLHQLTHNYRSHAGILKLSSTIVQLLKLFFPSSIDRPKPDVGLFPGPNPVIIDTDDFTELAILLKGSRRQTSTIEFGAHQVVLVQNDESKERLPPELSYGLVLSIYEAKGLEFDDVLLYNFFKDSPASEEWRVIASNADLVNVEVDDSSSSMKVIHEEDLEIKYRPLEFDYNKHKLLNLELKKLYTAITRARVNVWIFDEDKKKRAPMFDFLVKKHLVDVAKLEEEVTRHSFAEQSSKNEWNKRGLYFYKKNLFKLAAKCAETAGNKELNGKCLAKLQFVQALDYAKDWKLKPGGKSVNNVYMRFKHTALSFLKCGLTDDAKVCLRNAKEYNFYAMICEKQEQFSEAAKYFKTAAKRQDALRCFKLAGNHRSVMKLLKEEKCFLEALDYQFTFSSSSEMEKNDLVNSALNVFYENGDQQYLRKVLSYMDYGKQVEYLENKVDLQPMLEEIYKSNNKVEELAQFYLKEKKFLEVAKVSKTNREKAILTLQAFKVSTYALGSSGDSELKGMIKDCLKLVDQKEHVLRAELQYVYMYLTGDTKLMKDTISLYNQSGDDIGKLLSLILLIKTEYGNMSPTFGGIFNPFRKISDLVKSILEFIPDMGNENSSNDWIKSVYKKFGFSLNGKLYKIEDKNTLVYFLELAGLPITVSLNKYQVTSAVARTTCVKIALNLVGSLVCTVRKLGVSLYESKLICEQRSSCQIERCGKMHRLPKSQDLTYGCEVICFMLRLSFYCNEGKQNISKSLPLLHISHGEWMNYSKDDMYMIYELLQSYIPYLHLVKNISYAESLLKNGTLPLQTLETLMREKWDDDVESKKVNIEIYCALSFLSYMADKKSPFIDQLRASKKEKYYPFNQFQLFQNALESLYFFKNIKNALNQFLNLVKKLPPPTNTFCDIMEVPLVFMLTSIAATAPSVDYPLFLPTSYIEYVYNWDVLYGETPSTFNNAIGRLHRKKKNWEDFYDHMKELCKILSSESDDSPFQLLIKSLKYADQNRKPLNHARHASRMICLYLVVLSNLEGSLRDFGLSLISPFKSNEVEGKHELINYFNQIKNLKRPEDARMRLSKFLARRNGVLQKCTWSSKHQKLYMLNVISQNSNFQDSIEVNKIKILQRSYSKELFQKLPNQTPKKEQRELANDEISSNSMATDQKEETKHFQSEEMLENQIFAANYEDDNDLELENDLEAEDEMLRERLRLKEEKAAALAKEAVVRKYTNKWFEYVRIKKQKRLRQNEEQSAALNITEFFRFVLKEKRGIKKLKDHEQYFSEDICGVCKVKCENKKFHIQEDEHLENVKDYNKHNEIKDSFEDAYNRYIDFDKIVLEMEKLLMKYNSTLKLLTHGKDKMLYPHNTELQEIVEAIEAKMNTIESTHRDLDTEHFDEFEDIADSMAKISSVKSRKGKK